MALKPYAVIPKIRIEKSKAIALMALEIALINVNYIYRNDNYIDRRSRG